MKFYKKSDFAWPHQVIVLPTVYSKSISGVITEQQSKIKFKPFGKLYSSLKLHYDDSFYDVIPEKSVNVTI